MGSVSTVLNPIFSKKVQGQKHPGRWGIVEHQIPSIKVLFKTYTKGHKHPSIRLISKSKTQLVNQRKQKVAFSPGTVHFPEIQSYRTWWGAASPTLNDTPVIYTYIYIYLRPITELMTVFGNIYNQYHWLHIFQSILRDVFIDAVQCIIIKYIKMTMVYQIFHHGLISYAV